MTSEEREEERGGANGSSRLGLLAGLVAAFVAILAVVAAVVRDGLPESFWEIVLLDAIFVGGVAVFALLGNQYLAFTGRRTFLRGHSGLALLLVVVGFMAIAGALSAVGSTAEQRPVRGSARYAEQLRSIFGELRRAGALAYGTPAAVSRRGAYSRSARELGEAYGEASAELSAVRVGRDDVTLHWRLVNRLGEVGDAYLNLGQVVGAGSARGAEVDSAQDAVGAAMGRLRRAEGELAHHGYRIVFPDG